MNPRDDEESSNEVDYQFGLSRRGFVQVLGAGLLIAVPAGPVLAQRSRNRNRPGLPVAARVHIGKDGVITVMTGKVEMGQGARAELTQSAAEELKVAAAQVQLIMGDTSIVPDDGVTAGSRTTPYTVPAIRQGAAAARSLLIELACQKWGVPHDEVRL
ncbi:MAG: molybdopterin-dependent oxidoreductase, partial [Candidatus Omnitrophica bacterium]|nr:molybdopterin-dependent oxidoreductase [Candidatus Omnitrophota bacterium]